MSYVLNDDVLWANRVGVHEYRFAALEPGVGAAWDPVNSTGVLTNDGRTVEGGQNLVENDWAAPLPQYPTVAVAWMAELTIDSVNDAMRVGVWNAAAAGGGGSATSTCYWSADGRYRINYGQEAGNNGGDPGDPAWAWSLNDKIGIAIVGNTSSPASSNVWFFKNGVLLGQGVIQYYVSPPFRLWARPTDGRITVNCDLPSMAFATAYFAEIGTVEGWHTVTPATRLIATPASQSTYANATVSVTVTNDNTLVAPVVVTLTSSDPSDLIDPLTVTLSAAQPSAIFQINGSVLGEHSVTMTNDGDLENPDPLTVTIEEPPTTTPLASGETVSVSGGAGSQQYFSIVVPAGQSALTIRATSGTGDADLYVNRDQYPTTTSYLDASQLPGKTNETIQEDEPEAGTWIVLVYGHAAFADASLTLTITP